MQNQLRTFRLESETPLVFLLSPPPPNTQCIESVRGRTHRWWTCSGLWASIWRCLGSVWTGSARGGSSVVCACMVWVTSPSSHPHVPFMLAIRLAVADYEEQVRSYVDHGSAGQFPYFRAILRAYLSHTVAYMLSWHSYAAFSKHVLVFFPHRCNWLDGIQAQVSIPSLVDVWMHGYTLSLWYELSLIVILSHLTYLSIFMQATCMFCHCCGPHLSIVLLSLSSHLIMVSLGWVKGRKGSRGRAREGEQGQRE